MSGGWVKLFRKSLDSAVWQDQEVWRMWTWMLMKASHKPHQTLVKKTSVRLGEGQLIFSRAKASEETGLSERTVRTCLAALISLDCVSIKTTNKFSIVSITKWHTYQDSGNTNDQQNDQQATSKRPANDQPFLRDKKGKNGKTSSTPGGEEFETFWEAYPKKKAKGDALKAWTKLNGTRPQLETLLSAIAAQKAGHDWQKDGGQFIPHPATWLNGRRWEDGMTGADPKPQSAESRRKFWDEIPDEWRASRAAKYVDVLTDDERRRYAV